MEKKQILSNDISKAIVDILFACSLLTQDNKQVLRLIMKKMYEENMHIYKERKLLLLYYIDLSLL